jgi:hypothetical protein
MHLTTRRLFQLGVGLLATTVPAFCGAASCSFVTPEPSTFWVISAGAGAILLVRHMRSKK